MLVKLPWKRGTATDGPVVVAVTRTDFARYRDMPGAMVAALRLRRAVPRTPGAIGLTLAVEAPWRRRSWSISAWSTDAELQAFIHSPEHLAIVRRYRHRLTVQSETWTVSRFALREAWREAARRFRADPRD
ncbi:MAG: hypothetical protein QOD38_1586 [Acidimicrobiaceae bacterium]|jgi:heme-degrading monooxygenase HmoA